MPQRPPPPRARARAPLRVALFRPRDPSARLLARASRCSAPRPAAAAARSTLHRLSRALLDDRRRRLGRAASDPPRRPHRRLERPRHPRRHRASPRSSHRRLCARRSVCSASGRTLSSSDELPTAEPAGTAGAEVRGGAGARVVAAQAPGLDGGELHPARRRRPNRLHKVGRATGRGRRYQDAARPPRERGPGPPTLQPPPPPPIEPPPPPPRPCRGRPPAAPAAARGDASRVQPRRPTSSTRPSSTCGAARSSALAACRSGSQRAPARSRTEPSRTPTARCAPRPSRAVAAPRRPGSRARAPTSGDHLRRLPACAAGPALLAFILGRARDRPRQPPREQAHPRAAATTSPRAPGIMISSTRSSARPGDGDRDACALMPTCFAALMRRVEKFAGGRAEGRASPAPRRPPVGIEATL